MIFNVTYLNPSSAMTADEQRKWAEEEYGKIPKITAQQAYAMFVARKIVIVDASLPNRFKNRHCKGAISFPETMVNKIKKIKFPKKTMFAVY